MAVEKSLATAQLSLGPDKGSFALFPPKLRGVESLDGSYQYPLEIGFEYFRLDRYVLSTQRGQGMLRWRSLLPPILDELSLGEGGTPLIELPGQSGQAKVFLKDESRNPTFSHKDRLNLCVVSAAKMSGARGIVAASTGNHGISTAAYAAKAGLPCIILVPERFSKSYFAALNAYGAHAVPVKAERKFEILGKFVAELGFHPTSNSTRYHTGHPFGPEGYKTIAYELFDQLGRAPAAVVVPTGYAELLFGIVKGFQELIELGLTGDLPQAFSAEPAGLAPLATALDNRLPMAAVSAADSRLTSIACTVSSYRGVWAISKSKGAALRVTDQEALKAQAKYARMGLWQELSSSAALAAVDFISPNFQNKDVVVIGTSSGVKDPIDWHTVQRVCSTVDEAVSYLKDVYAYNPGPNAQ
ncbi:pyridoxal-phosphate dependent enzyme [Bradyrhizobium sp. CCBAU 53421]|uniref:threonine synthase n=1 Tax=Bradyrhizobium sp. CCBAU 53421 TaxID=1325120 RepID=UPI00188DBEDB|nr:pyridoxal-phosphate dependent enzyme [Bradyrhizobium sp. CCBAU 53421]QOZ38374.1 threonine synthase [Bradyrhizobium sp. CCBAU 53421]